MRIRTFEECVKAYGAYWDPDNDKKRSETLKTFPFSIVVEGAYLEYDTAESWLVKNEGPQGDKWTYVWYMKTDYDYGYWEFCFKSETDVARFREAVLTF